MADDMSKYREMFAQEANEHMQILNRCLLQLENNPRDKKLLDEAFRSAHTVKGMSATMGYDSIRKICAAVEERFEKFRKGEAVISREIAGYLFRCFDLLSQLINDENKVVNVDDLLLHLPSESNTSAIDLAGSEQELDGATAARDPSLSLPPPPS